jgi:oxalate decarboxylase/phosphoglucose isomerase-like protein (cupin superfamily)
MDFSANDVAFVPAMTGQHLQNTGDKDLVFLGMFAAGEFQKIPPNKWVRASPQLASVGHTKEKDLERIPANGNLVIRPFDPHYHVRTPKIEFEYADVPFHTGAGRNSK